MAPGGFTAGSHILLPEFGGATTFLPLMQPGAALIQQQVTGGQAVFVSSSLPLSSHVPPPGPLDVIPRCEGGAGGARRDVTPPDAPDSTGGLHREGEVCRRHTLSHRPVTAWTLTQPSTSTDSLRSGGSLSPRPRRPNICVPGGTCPTQQGCVKGHGGEGAGKGTLMTHVS